MDTGLPGSAGTILEYAQSLGIDPEKVAYIVLTHADIDHSGSAAELRDLTGARIAIHADDAGCLDGTKEPKTVKGFFGMFFKLFSLVIRFRHFEPDIILKDGNEIGGFKVIHTPGHTDGSICLCREGEVVFVGDVLRSDKYGNLLLPSPKMSKDMVEAVNSLRKISQLEFDVLLAGHGSPVVGKASDKVRHLLANVR